MITPKIRPSKEFYELINGIKARCLTQNKRKKCPSTATITRVIAMKINEELFWEKEFNGR